MKQGNETIFALSTNKGKSATAVFRVSGANSHKIVKSISSKKKFKNNYATLNNLLDSNEIIDQTITTFFKSPKSYTGEDMVEISCHGSVSVINKITKTLLEKKTRYAVLVPPKYWCSVKFLKENSVLLVLNDRYYEFSDYLETFDDYKKYLLKK